MKTPDTMYIHRTMRNQKEYIFRPPVLIETGDKITLDEEIDGTVWIVINGKRKQAAEIVDVTEEK